MTESQKSERCPQGVALELCGQMLYGEIWQSAMANDLGLSSTRRIRQFLSGDIVVPNGIWAELEAKLAVKHNLTGQALESVQAVRKDAMTNVNKKKVLDERKL